MNLVCKYVKATTQRITPKLVFEVVSRWNYHAAVVLLASGVRL